MTAPPSPMPEVRLPCNACLSRRAFLTRGTLAMAGAAAMAAGCGDGQFGPEIVVIATRSPVSFKVATVPGLASTGQLVRVPSVSLQAVVKRTGASSFYAMTSVCTHQQCDTNIVGNHLECPCHDSRFDSDGHVTQGPASSNLDLYATSYDPATDTLTIG